MTYTLIFANGEKIQNLSLTDKNFIVPKSLDINYEAPVIITNNKEEILYNNCALVDGGERWKVIPYNTDGKNWTFTLNDNTLITAQRTQNGYFITQTPVSWDMFLEEFTISNGEIEETRNENDFVLAFQTNDSSYWFSFRKPFNEYSYTIILSDGTTINSLKKNIDCWISKTPINPSIFENNCGKITIRNPGDNSMFDNVNIHKDLEFSGEWEQDNEYWFTFRKIPQEEIEAKITKAQNQALVERNEFLEDCIAEMAGVIYA